MKNSFVLLRSEGNSNFCLKSQNNKNEKKKSLLPDGRAAGVNETDFTAGGAGP